MTEYIGDFLEDETVYHYFNTFDSNDPAASVTMTTLIDSDLYVYKDGNTTEAVTDGATVAINFDSRTGIHLLTIDTSAHAFYATGSDYMVMIEGATVDGGNITAAIFTFSIENRFNAAVTDGATLAAGAITNASLAGNMEIVFETDFGTNYNTARNAWVNNYTDIIGTMGNASFAAGALTSTEITSAAGITLANGAITDVSLAGNMEIVFETDFATNYNTTRNAWATNVQDQVGTGNLTADVIAISGDATAANNAESFFDGTGYAGTNNVIPSVTTVTGNVNGNVGGNVTGSVGSNIELGPAEVQAEVDTALATIHLDHLLAVDAADVVVNASVIAHMVSATEDWSTFVPSTDSLQAVRDRGDAAWTTGAGGAPPTTLQNTTIATLATQVSFTLTAGSADNGAYIGMIAIVEDQTTATQKAVGRISAYTGASKTVTLESDPGIFTMAAGDTIDIVALDPILPVTTEATLADTNELQGDWANAGRLDAILDSRMAEASIDTTAGAVDNVTLVATTTTNSDMVTEPPTTAQILAALFTGNQALDTTAGVLDVVGSISGNVDGNVTGSVGSNIELGPAEVNTEVDNAIITYNLDHLLLTATVAADMTAEVADNTIMSRILANGDTSAFVPSTDGLQPIRDHIGDGTNLPEAGGDGDHLTAINLPNQTMDITGTIDTVTTVTSRVTANTDQIEGADATDTLLAAVDAALDTAINQLAQGAPTATPTMRTGLILLYMLARNKVITQTSGTDALELYADNGTTLVLKKLLSDDGSDYTEAEMTSGA